MSLLHYALVILMNVFIKDNFFLNDTTGTKSNSNHGTGTRISYERRISHNIVY